MTSTKTLFSNKVTFMGIGDEDFTYLFGEHIQPAARLLMKTSENCGEVFSFQALEIRDF